MVCEYVYCVAPFSDLLAKNAEKILGLFHLLDLLHITILQRK